LARLVRFYHLSPGQVLTLPATILQALGDHLGRLQAEETERALVISLAPYVAEHHRRSLAGQLQRQIALDLDDIAKPTPPIEYDKEKARAYFEALGAKVV